MVLTGASPVRTAIGCAPSPFVCGKFDVAAVKGSFKEMLENGVYKADLFSDL